MRTSLYRRLARMAFTGSLMATCFCLLVELSSMVARHGKPIELVANIGMASAVILVISIAALHLLSKRGDTVDPFET